MDRVKVRRRRRRRREAVASTNEQQDETAISPQGLCRACP